MSTFKKSLIAAALVTTGAAAQAEVSGSAAIASSYLWRGFDLGYGSAVVSGSLDYGHESGFYAGIWGSSGDDSYGSEYDLYFGWGGNVTDDVTVDISYVDYNYPNTLGATDFEEVMLGVGFGAFSLTFVEPTTSGADYNYFAGSADFGDFNVTIGGWSGDADGTHIDLTYALGDLAFTLSQASGDSYDIGSEDPDTLFMVSYSLPIGE